MKKIFYYCALVFGILLTSCSNDENQISDIDRTIRLIPKIEGHLVGTRAVENAATQHGSGFVDGEEFFVDIFYTGTTDEIPSFYDYGSRYENPYSSGKINIGDDITFPLDGSAIDVLSFYPSNINGSSWLANDDFFRVQTDQSLDKNYQLSDYMWAFAEGKFAGESIDLNFNHVMSKIIVKLNGYEGTASNYSVTINQVQTYTKLDNHGTQNVAIGTTAEEDKEIDNIQMGTYGDAGVTAIVIPQKISSGHILFKVNVDSNEYTYTTGSEITFETGHVYTFTLNFTGVNISTGNLSIEPWTGKDAANHNYQGNLE